MAKNFIESKKGGSKYDLEEIEEMSVDAFKYGALKVVCGFGMMVTGFVAGIGIPKIITDSKYNIYSLISACLFVLLTVLFFINVKKYKEAKNKDKLMREKIISSVVPVKGEITNVIKYITQYENGQGVLYAALVEYYEPSIGTKRTIESCKFGNDISKLLRSNKVNIYFKPDGSGYYIGDFDVRRDEWDIQAKIPLTSEIEYAD